MTIILFVTLLAASGLAVDLTLFALYGGHVPLWHALVVLAVYAAFHIVNYGVGSCARDVYGFLTSDVIEDGPWKQKLAIVAVILVFACYLLVSGGFSFMFLALEYGTKAVSWWHPVALFGVYMVAGTAFNFWAGRLKS